MIDAQHKLFVVRGLKASAVDLFAAQDALSRAADSWARVHDKLAAASERIGNSIGRLADMAMEAEIDHEKVVYLSGRAVLMHRQCHELSDWIERYR